MTPALRQSGTVGARVAACAAKPRDGGIWDAEEPGVTDLMLRAGDGGVAGRAGGPLGLESLRWDRGDAEERTERIDAVIVACDGC